MCKQTRVTFLELTEQTTFSTILWTPTFYKIMATKYYTKDEDLELMDQVVLYNPFAKANSWEKFKAQLNDKSDRSSKSMRDRAMLLMDQRRRVVARQEAASGIDEPPRSLLEVALDEAILLEREANEQDRGSRGKRKSETSRGDADILTAAEKRRPPPQQVDEPQAGTSTENSNANSTAPTRVPPTSQGKRRPVKSQELTAIMNLKLDEAKRQREEDKQEREEERKLRREELEILRREVALREKQEENRDEERRLLVQIMQGLVNVLQQWQNN